MIFREIPKVAWFNQWLLFNTKWAIFSYIIARTNYIWFLRDDDVRFALDQHAGLDFYSTRSLKQQSEGRLVAPHRYILIPNQPVLLLLRNAVFCLAEKQ